jgi:hypothetical protein
MKSNSTRLMVLAVLLALSGLVAGCGNTEFKSAWRDREITVDGKDTDWSGVSVYSIGDPGVAVGLLNDESNLYILLKTHDRSLLPRLTRGGFMVWFDPSGKKNKSFGIHFPIGGQEMGMPEMPREGFQGERKADTSGQAPEEFPKRMEEALKNVELIGPTKGQRCTLAVADAEAKGVKARMTFSTGELVYEVEVPLRPDAQHPYAIAIPANPSNQAIGIGFETGKFERPKREGFSEGGGGEGGGGGWGGGRGGGMSPPEGSRMPKEFNLWAIVKLASKK